MGVDQKTTQLHDFHVRSGANMALFGNYDMPLWYKTGAKAEHLAVIQKAGVFDTSHMAIVSVQGASGRELIQYCFTKDLECCIGSKHGPLVDGRCVYGVFLNEDGTVLDDAIVYQIQADSYMVVVNAGMGPEIAGRLRSNSREDVAVVDLTGTVGKMDIQGPAAAKVLKELFDNPAEVFDGLVYFSFRGGFAEIGDVGSVRLKDGPNILLSRTGYTGEFGFELYTEVENLDTLWELVLNAGKPFGVIPCGLASRDSLRAGAVLPLSHQDIGPWPFAYNPWLFALPTSPEKEGFTKDFIGRESLEKLSEARYTLPFAGFDPRKIAVNEKSYVEDDQGTRIGTILTCTTDMAIGRVDGEIRSISQNEDFAPKGLCCGFVLLEKNYQPGKFIILTDGKRKIKVEIRADIRPSRTARSALKTMLD